MIPELTAEWLRMKFGLPPEAAVRAADELLFRLGLRKEFGVKERGEPEPGWLSDYNDLPVRDGEVLNGAVEVGVEAQWMTCVCGTGLFWPR